MNTRRIDFGDFHWLDIFHPTPEDLKAIGEKYKLHPTSVQDCLQSEHLPKFELIEEIGFVILRAYDHECNEDADTVQELTRKVAVFCSNTFLITIHRKDMVFLEEMFTKYQGKAESKANITPEHILADILNGVVRTYEKPVLNSLLQLEDFEMEIFGAKTRRQFRLQKGYYLRRRASVFKRMLRATIEPLTSIMENAEVALLPYFKNVREHIDNTYFYADEVTDSMDSLLNLHVSLASQKTNEASHRTNEVVRVLTIFSVFFLPINFIAGIYGMNFEIMPELKLEYGYPAALGLMGAVVLTIFVWMHRKGWLK